MKVFFTVVGIISLYYVIVQKSRVNQQCKSTKKEGDPRPPPRPLELNIIRTIEEELRTEDGVGESEGTATE